MKINNVKFIKSFVNYDEEFSNEICILGRSNVGKSTFINTLVNQRIAKTSSMPGRTRLINVFEINKGDFHIIDLPGYGYARASKEEINKWQKLTDSYFKNTKNLKLCIVLVDCRVLSPLDSQMLNYLYFNNLPFRVLFSKSDKLSKAELNKNINSAAAFLKIGIDNIIPISNKGFNMQKVLEQIESATQADLD